MGLGMALFPYAVLTAVATAILLISNLEVWLETISFGPPFPEVSTGYGFVNESKDDYSPITPLIHSGFFLFVACANTWTVYKRRGIRPCLRSRCFEVISQVHAGCRRATASLISQRLLVDSRLPLTRLGDARGRRARHRCVADCIPATDVRPKGGTHARVLRLRGQVAPFCENDYARRV